KYPIKPLQFNTLQAEPKHAKRSTTGSTRASRLFPATAKKPPTGGFSFPAIAAGVNSARVG
ncbi:hypothetical protein V2A21_25160, partial [Pseudomonas aeruginosa]